MNHLLPKNCKDFKDKIFDGLINTEVRLKHMEKSLDWCCICKNGDENFERVLCFCMYYCQFQDRKYGRGETIFDTMMGIFL